MMAFTGGYSINFTPFIYSGGRIDKNRTEIEQLRLKNQLPQQNANFPHLEAVFGRE